MRQAGVLAAAGVVALQSMVERLADDHRHARQLAQRLETIPGLVLDPGTPKTNMLFCSLADGVPLSASQVAAALAERGLRVGVVAPRRFRLVTHYWIGDEDVTQAVAAFRDVLA
jgi:threonine aldolase